MEVAVLVQRAEHRPGGGRPLFLRVVVMLDADAAEERMQVVRHVSRREYVWNIGAASGVDQHTVVEGHVGALEDVDVRLDADRTIAKSQSSRRPRLVTACSTRCVPS